MPLRRGYGHRGDLGLLAAAEPRREHRVVRCAVGGDVCLLAAAPLPQPRVRVEARLSFNTIILPELVSKINTVLVFEHLRAACAKVGVASLVAWWPAVRRAALARWLYTRRAPIGPKSRASHSNASRRECGCGI